MSTGDDWTKGSCPTLCGLLAELHWPVLLAFFPIDPGALEMGPRLASHLFLWLSLHLLGIRGGKVLSTPLAWGICREKHKCFILTMSEGRVHPGFWEGASQRFD